MGLGTWQSKDEIARISVLAALSHDYRLIDTAAAYGNERGVGAGIKDSGLKREEIFVTSKLRNADHGYKATMDAFELSMEKLGLEYLDLYLIHWPNPVQYRFIWKKAMQETWRAFVYQITFCQISVLGKLSDYIYSYFTIRKQCLTTIT